MTTADEIAEQFDDAIHATLADGTPLGDVCSDAGAVLLVQGTVSRWHFPDGSGIIEDEYGWDLGYVGNEYRDCFCYCVAKMDEQTGHYHCHLNTCPHYEDA